MRVGILVRIEKMHIVLLVLVIPLRLAWNTPPCLDVGKVGLCGSDFFLYPDCTVMWSTVLLIC